MTDGTTPALYLALAAIVGYLCGSIPFGLILTRLTGAGDLRAIGSGNIGATNVLRTGRKGLALATLLCDFAKGLLPTLIIGHVLGLEAALLAGAGAVLGHCFPVWVGFKGGKGVATAAGVIAALSPISLLIALAVFIAAVAATRFVSLGSILAAVVAPCTAWLLGGGPVAALFLGIGLLVIFMHRANIRRLLAGNENRLSFGKS